MFFFTHFLVIFLAVFCSHACVAGELEKRIRVALVAMADCKLDDLIFPKELPSSIQILCYRDFLIKSLEQLLEASKKLKTVALADNCDARMSWLEGVSAFAKNYAPLLEPRAIVTDGVRDAVKDVFERILLGATHFMKTPELAEKAGVIASVLEYAIQVMNAASRASQQAQASRPSIPRRFFPDASL